MTAPAKRQVLFDPGMLLVTLFWGANFTALKIAFTEIEPFAFTALRFSLATAVLWGMVRYSEGSAPLPKGAFWPLVCLGVVGNTLYQLCFMMGLSQTSAIRSALILSAMPASVTLAAWALGIEKVTVKQRIAVIVSTIGVVIVLVTRGGSIGGGIGKGELLLLLGVLLWAIYTLLMRHWTLPISSLRLTAWTMYTGTPVLVIVGMPQLLRTDWSNVTVAGWGGVLYAALLSLVAAYVLWNRGVVRLGISRTVVYNTLVPLIATAIAWVGLGERPGLIHLVGGSLVVGGVLLTGRGAAPEG